MSDPQLRALARRIRTLEKAALHAKQPTLGFSTIDGGGAIQATDESETLTMVVGKQFDGTNTASVVVGPTPPKPTLPLVTPQMNALSIYWDGTFADGGVAPMDFSRVLVYAEPLLTYDGPDPMNQALVVGEFNTATGGEVSFILEPGVDHAVYLVCWSQAGKFSAASDVATAQAQTLSASVADIIADMQSDINAVTTTANGKNSVTYSTSAASPGTPGTRQGDIWFQYTGSTVIGHWRWDGDSWEPQTLDNAVIANLDAGKINTGFLAAARIAATSITVDKLAIGFGENQIANPGFENGLGPHTAANGATATVVTTKRSGAQGCKIDVPASTVQTSRLWAQGTHTDPTRMARTKVGDRFHWGYWAKGDVGTTTVDAWIMIKDATGVTQLQSVTGTDIVLSAGGPWTYVSVEADVTDPGAAVVGLFVRGWNAGTSATSFIIDDMMGRAMVNGSLIVNGTITASNLATDAVTTVSLAADAITSKHTITGAKFRTAASGQRWELDSLNSNEIRGYSGVAGESFPGSLVVDDSGGIPMVILQSGQITGAQPDNGVLSLDGGRVSDSSPSSADLSAQHASLSGFSTSDSIDGTAQLSATIFTGTQNGGIGIGVSAGKNTDADEVARITLGSQMTIKRASWASNADEQFVIRDGDLNELFIKHSPAGQGLGAAGAYGAPFLSRTHAFATSIANNTFTTVAYSTNVDTRKISSAGGVHTIDVRGMYDVHASIAFAANVTGRRIIRMLHNGTEIARDERDANAGLTNVEVSRKIEADEGDTITIQVWQNSGAALALQASILYNHMDIAWLGWGNRMPIIM